MIGEFDLRAVVKSTVRSYIYGPCLGSVSQYAQQVFTKTSITYTRRLDFTKLSNIGKMIQLSITTKFMEHLISYVNKSYFYLKFSQ